MDVGDHDRLTGQATVIVEDFDARNRARDVHEERAVRIFKIGCCRACGCVAGHCACTAGRDGDRNSIAICVIGQNGNDVLKAFAFQTVQIFPCGREIDIAQTEGNVLYAVCVSIVCRAEIKRGDRGVGAVVDARLSVTEQFQVRVGIKGFAFFHVAEEVDVLGARALFGFCEGDVDSNAACFNCRGYAACISQCLVLGGQITPVQKQISHRYRSFNSSIQARPDRFQHRTLSPRSRPLLVKLFAEWFGWRLVQGTQIRWRKTAIRSTDTTHPKDDIRNKRPPPWPAVFAPQLGVISS